jgi:putative Holliday junction resolvase
MPRLLAIDYGTKRVGLAVTDPLQLIATALDTIHSKDVLAYIKNYMLTEEIEAFVVGMPQNLNAKATNNTIHVQNFGKLLQKTFPHIPIHWIDERFTTKIALDTMIAGGTKKKDRQNKANLDKISAVVILQSYMETKSPLSPGGRL